MYWKESKIVDFDDEYVFAECLADGLLKGKILRIPKLNVHPNEWISTGEHIWHVEHNIWNFVKMFDKREV